MLRFLIEIFVSHGAVHLPLGVPSGDGFTLVVGLFTLAKAQLHLDAAVLEVEGQGDEGVAVLLLQRLQLADLPFVHQKALGAVGVAVEDIALLVGGDVHLVGVDLAVLGHAEGVLQIGLSAADGLDLGTEQLDTGLVALLHEIVVEGLAVLHRRLDAFLFHG